MALGSLFKRWGGIAVVLILAGLIAWSDYVFLFIHSFINIFAGGRSFTKVVLFLVYLLLILLAINLKVALPKIKDRWKNVLVGAVLLAYLLNIGSFIWFYHHYGFNYQDYVIAENHGELSSTKLLHNHTFKVVSGTILSFTHKANQENIDTGYAFVGMVPDWVAWAGIILIIVVLYLLAWQFLSAWQQEKFPRLYGLIFAIVTFSIVKNIVDGGPFTHEAAVSIPLFVYLVFRGKAWLKNAILIWALFYVALVVGCYWLGMYSGFSDFSFQLYLICLYAFAMMALFYVSWGKAVNRPALLCGIFIALMFYYPLSADLSLASYRHQAIGDEGALVGLFHDPHNPAYKPVKILGNMTIYSYLPDQHTTVGQILNEQDLLDNFQPVTVPGETCLTHGSRTRFDFVLSTFEQFHPVTVKEMFNSIKELGSDHGLFRYQVELAFPQCWPREVNVVEQYFLSAGLHNFFISDLEIKS